MNFKQCQVNWRPTSRPTPMPAVKRASDSPQSVGTLGLPFCRRADIGNVCTASHICMPTVQVRFVLGTAQKQCVLSMDHFIDQGSQHKLNCRKHVFDLHCNLVD